ncbi:MAG: hypothetical protein KF773_30185 [Deltaproteobacteria bacterium]|nr:hypothetical protein [Deltaproteobacteria bacterium]
MNQLLLGCAALASIVGAQGIREVAVSERAKDEGPPLAPSPGAAPFASLGYRELLADLLYARLRTYIGGGDTDADAAAGLVEAIVALDPAYRRIYDFGVGAMTVTTRGVDQETYLRAINVLEKGMEVFPDDWRIPTTAAQIYSSDLATDDAALRRAWDERAVRLFEIATRKPGAPAYSAVTVASLRTRLGQHQRARDGLREMLLVSGDSSARARILEVLREIEQSDHDLMAGELLEARNQFDRTWTRERPALPATMYVLLGPPLEGGTFDMGDLALGGRPPIEPPPPPLEPLGP